MDPFAWFFVGAAVGASVIAFLARPYGPVPLPPPVTSTAPPTTAEFTPRVSPMPNSGALVTIDGRGPYRVIAVHETPPPGNGGVWFEADLSLLHWTPDRARLGDYVAVRLDTDRTVRTGYLTAVYPEPPTRKDPTE